MKKLILAVLLLTLVITGCKTKNTLSYTIALDPEWSTIDIKGREQNLLGFTTDVLTEIAHQEGVAFTLIQRNWDALTEGLFQKKYQGMLSTLQPYNFNLRAYDFSHLFFATGPVLVVGFHSSVTSLEALHGKEIAIQENTFYDALLETDPSILPRTYLTIPQALNAVANGEIEGALVDILTAQTYCNDLYKDRLKIVTAPLNDQGLRLLTLHEQNEALIPLFNAGLKKLHASGKFQELQKKWFLTTYCPQ